MTREIDVAAAREDTPGCRRRVHFNNAGAALPPKIVTDAQIEHLRLEAEIGGYEAAHLNEHLIERTYAAAAELVGGHRSEIALMENATRAWDMAFYGVPLGPGDRILTCGAEYPGNYVGMLHRARQTGARVEIIPDSESGEVSVEALRKAIDGRVRLIAVTHVPTNNGLVNPAREVGRLAREAGILYLLDASQSAGQLCIDVNEIGCDMLVVTGRKYLRGPRGTACLWVRKDIIPRINPPLLDQTAADIVSAERFEAHPDARRFETWEASISARIGLGVAIDYSLKIGIRAIETRVVRLAETLRETLRRIPGITVRDVGREKCGIVTFTHSSMEPAAMRDELSARGINTYVRPATPIDAAVGRPLPVLRASLHYYNSAEEIDQFREALSNIVKR